MRRWGHWSRALSLPWPGRPPAGGDGRHDAAPGWCPTPLATRCGLSQTPCEPWACTDISPSSSSASMPQVGASRSQCSRHPLSYPGWMTDRKGTGELGCSHIPGADPRMGKEIGIWVEVGSGHHTCSGYCLGVLSIVRILLGILLGITVAYLDTTEISSEHDTEGTLGPSQGIARAHLAGWGDTLLFAGTFIRATGKSGCFGPDSAWEGNLYLHWCSGAGAELHEHSWMSRQWSLGFSTSPA